MKYSFQLDTDHFQFYLEDLALEHDASLLWSDLADPQLDSLDGLLAIATMRWGLDTAVTIELQQSVPDDTDAEIWDLIRNAYIRTVSGKLHVTTPEGQVSQAPFISIMPGIYNVRVYYGGFNSVLDELALQGEDKYKLTLWPQSSPAYTP